MLGCGLLDLDILVNLTVALDPARRAITDAGWVCAHLSSTSTRAAKRWELNTVLIVNTNNRTTVGLANNTGQR